MINPPPAFTLEETSGDKYPDLASAQAAALGQLGLLLAAQVRRMLQTGELLQEDGRIIPNPNPPRKD